MGAAGNGRATRQRGVQEIVQARGVVTIPTTLRTYKLTNLRTYIKDLKKRVKGWEMYLKEIVYINIYIYYFFGPDRVLFSLNVSS